MMIGGSDDFEFLRAVMALAFVIGLVLVIGWVARRGKLPGLPSATNAASRIQVLQSRLIDSKTRLVLVRIDDHDHALLLGTNGCVQLDPTMALSGMVDQ